MPIEPVSIIIPTWNNPEYLIPAIESMYATKNHYPLEFIVVNNGHPSSVEILKTVPNVKIIQCPDNLGWEGGLKEGLKHTKREFVMFANDDIFIPYAQTNWLRNMMHYFSDAKVGAIGPTSNCVMGLQQIFNRQVQGASIYSNYLIGFCMLLRREALEKSGGVDDSLPGGDDLDLSIRLKKSGYKLVICREAFVYHHGFKTGERIHGGPDKGGWNSQEMHEKTTHALITKHGLRTWFDTMYGNVEIPECDKSDSEGHNIRNMIHGSSVLELGCGGQKTVPHSVGVDFYSKGEIIPTINQKSVADIVCSVENLNNSELKGRKFDYIIARHILEHLIDPIAALKHWSEFLTPNGSLIIAVPDDSVCESISLNPEHKHAFTKDSLINLFNSAGLAESKIQDSGNGHSLIARGCKWVESPIMCEAI